MKEVKDAPQNTQGELWAYRNIRKDIKKLREKFGENRPTEPCVLVSMNFSSNFSTGFTVARAMLGDIGVTFDKISKLITSAPHHLPRGNAALTESQNRSISGVLIFDPVNNNHCLFTNPFAERPVPYGFFPEVRVVSPTRESLSSQLKDLSNLMFWNVERC